MLSAFINKAIERRYPWQAKPRIVICIPCGATSVEKRAVFEAAIQSGARQAYLIEEPMAAAMGADLPVTEPTGSMVVDIGGGTTEVAVISLGGIVTSSSLRLAGNKMDEAIAMYLRDLLGIKVGERTAEIIKIKIGCAHQRNVQENQPRPRERHHFEWYFAHGRRRPAFWPRSLSYVAPRDSRLDERNGAYERRHGLP